MESDNRWQKTGEQRRLPEARYSYYRRCQVFRQNGEQCKAPAEKGAHICYAHAGQQAIEDRRKRERRAVLEEVVSRMRRRGKPHFALADIFMDFNAIQVTLAVMAQALIDGRVDCKTAGKLALDLQTMSKLLRLAQGKRRTAPPRMSAHRVGLKDATRDAGRSFTIEPKIHDAIHISPRICAHDRGVGHRVPHREEMPVDRLARMALALVA